MAVFAYFGPFIFETIYSPEDFESTRDYNFAEHKPVETLSRLQWVGDDTELLVLEGQFHYTYANPRRKLADLYFAAEHHEAYPLIYGSGEFRGFFVIEQIIATYEQFTADGVLATSRFKLKLKGVPFAQLFDPLVNPTPGHQPWGQIVDDNQGDDGLPHNIDTKAANATFGYVPKLGFTPPITAALGSPGTSAITSTPIGTSSGSSSVLTIPPASIVRHE